LREEKRMMSPKTRALSARGKVDEMNKIVEEMGSNKAEQK
jgi:hypothetical protein